MQSDESRHDPNELVEITDPKQLASVSGDALADILQFTTGVLGSKPGDHLKTVSTTVQDVLRGYGWASLKNGFRDYMDRGRIKRDYSSTRQFREGVILLADAIDNPLSSSEEVIEAMQKIFLVMASEELSTREDSLPLALLRVAKGLSLEELIVLRSTYVIANREPAPEPGKIHGAGEWLRVVAKELGWYEALVELQEQKLMDKKLVTGRLYSDRSGVTLGQSFRLTDLGVHLCEFIEHYEPKAPELTA